MLRKRDDDDNDENPSKLPNTQPTTTSQQNLSQSSTEQLNLSSLNSETVFEYEKVTDEILDFISHNVTRLKLNDSGNLRPRDFDNFKNLEYLVLRAGTSVSNNTITDATITKLEKIKHLEIYGPWTEIKGETLHLLPNLEYLVFKKATRPTRVKWDKLKLKGLETNDLNVSLSEIGELSTLEKLVIQIDGPKTPSVNPTTGHIQPIPGSFERCRNLSHIEIYGAPFFALLALSKLPIQTVRNIKVFVFNATIDISEDAYQTAELWLSRVIKLMNSLELLEISPMRYRNMVYDFSGNKNLQSISIDGYVNPNTIISIPSTCESISFESYFPLTADMIVRFKSAKTIHINCFHARTASWREKMDEIRNIVTMECRDLVLGGLSPLYAFELLNISHNIEHLTLSYDNTSEPKFLQTGGRVKSFTPDPGFTVRQDDPKHQEWIYWWMPLKNCKLLTSLTIIDNEYGIDLTKGLPFDYSILKQIPTLRKLVCDTTGYAAYGPKFSELIACKNLEKLELNVMLSDPKDIGLQNSDFSKLRHLYLTGGGIAYTAICKAAKNLTSIYLNAEYHSLSRIIYGYTKKTDKMSPDARARFLQIVKEMLIMNEDWFRGMDFLENLTLLYVDGIQGTFLQFVPSLEYLNISFAKDSMFDYMNLKKYAKTLHHLTDIIIHMNAPQKKEDEIHKAIGEAYPKASVIVNQRSYEQLLLKLERRTERERVKDIPNKKDVIKIEGKRHVGREDYPDELNYSWSSSSSSSSDSED